jgi:hypothetical protein
MIKKREQEQLAELKEKLAKDLHTKLQAIRKVRDKTLLEIQDDDKLSQHEKLQSRKDAKLRYFEMAQDDLEEARVREDKEAVRLFDGLEEETRVLMLPATKIRDEKLMLLDDGKFS